jgi:hypothetical protein
LLDVFDGVSILLLGMQLACAAAMLMVLLLLLLLMLLLPDDDDDGVDATVDAAAGD